MGGESPVRNSRATVPAEDNTVVIIAENNPRDRELLREQLMSAGMAGRLQNLQNKFIILQFQANQSLSDEAVLVFAHAEGRMLLTLNRKYFVR